MTDEGLEHLSQLTELDTLSLESTKVTDDGLRHLGGLSKLRMLQLNKTKVSGADWHTCKIFRSWSGLRSLM